MTFLVDICDTLFRSNTTFDFIRYVVRNHVGKRFAFAMITAKYSPLFWILILASKFTNKDIHRNLVLLLLKNRSRLELAAAAVQFYDGYLSKRKNPIVWRLLAREAEKIILVSSTIEPVAEVIAHKNNFSFRASTLNYESELFSGSIQVDLTGKKHQLVKELITEESYGVITDNFSDRELLKGATKRIVVINRPSHYDRWKEVDAVFIKNYG